MSACEEHRDRIEAYLSGTITPVDLSELVAHAAGCADCRAGLELHRELTRTGGSVPEPTEREFADMRRSVLDEVGARRPLGKPRLRPVEGRSAASLLRPLAFAAGLALAVLAGRWSVAPARVDDDMLLREIGRQAAARTDLEGYWDAPFSLDNVSVRSREGGELELGFDVSRHVELVADRDSPLAREALVHAIIDDEAIGSRIKALEMAQGMTDARMTEALVFALHNDPEPAVRLQALAMLQRETDPGLVRAELMRTLSSDPSVQLRLAALEALAASEVEPERLRDVIRTVELPGDQAVLQQALPRP